MAKTKISEYSTTNSSNTDINSINIDEGCAPSGINNAIREVMVHLRNWQTNASGDGATFASLVVQGTGSFTGAVTMSSGATLSGTNTLSGSNIISGNINSSGTTNTFSGGNILSGTNTLSGATVLAAQLGTSASPSIYFTSDTNTGIFSPTADTVAVATGGSERVRVDSSGNVGIGNASAVGKLEVYQNNNSGVPAIYARQDGTAPIQSWHVAAGTERARITSGGQLLVGATTSVGAGAGGIEIKNGSGALTTPLDSWNTATSGDNIFMSFATEGTYTARGSIDYNRGAGQVRYNATSDATLKNIIGDSDGQKSLEILNSTRIREYAWKDDAQQNKQVGVIAQELHETYKGAVSVGGEYEVEIPAVTEQRLVSEAVLDEEGNEIEAAVYETVEIEPSHKETKYRPWAVDKTAFTFHLIAGWQAHEKLLKEAMTRIEALEAEVAAMKAGNGN